MAISGFGRGRSEEMVQDIGSLVASQKSGAAALSAFIDQGSEFEGKLQFRDTVRIDGGFRGEIRSENTLVVGETGEIEADVVSGTVVISGSVVGNVEAQIGIVLHKTARVQGDVCTPSLVIEQGAVLNGRVEMKTPVEAGSGSKKKGLPSYSQPEQPESSGKPEKSEQDA